MPFCLQGLKLNRNLTNEFEMYSQKSENVNLNEEDMSVDNQDYFLNAQRSSHNTPDNIPVGHDSNARHFPLTEKDPLSFVCIYFSFSCTKQIFIY